MGITPLGIVSAGCGRAYDDGHPRGPLSGVAIHANVLVNLLQDDFLRPLTPTASCALRAAAGTGEGGLLIRIPQP